MTSFQNIQRILRAHVPYVNEPYSPPDKYDKDICKMKISTLLTPFNPPSKNDMLVILPYFSPCNSVRMLQNLLLVKSKLEESKTPFLIIHGLFPDSVEISQPSDTYMTVRTSSYAFLKENLANIVIKKVGSTYCKFVILDTDIIFEKKSWYDDLSVLLDTYDIVQPYNAFKCLDSNFLNVISSGTSAFANASILSTNEYYNGHPGYAIAFTKGFYDLHGYPDECVIGGGDTLICSIALKKPFYAYKTRSTTTFHYLYDKHFITQDIKITYLDGTVYHLYHNTYKNRQYTTRYLVLEKYISSEDSPYKSIDEIIYKNEDGVYEWIADIREEMNKTMLDYFYSRHDDEIN
jgi:hypothetical protein